MDVTRRQSFSVNAIRADTGETQISVFGEIDLATASELDRALSQHRGRVVVDLGKVPFMDSTGIRVLLSHKARLDDSGGRLRLLVTTNEIFRLFELTGLTDTFDIDASLHPAVLPHDG